MPYKRKYTTKPYKRKYTTKPKKRYQRRRNYSLMGRPGNLILPKFATMRYCEQITITSSSGILSSHDFRANSIFDPNSTGTGHQPMGRDTYATLYNHYMVTGAKITVKPTHNLAATVPYAIGVLLSDGAVPYTHYTEFIEAKKGSWRTVTGNATNTPSIVCKFSAKKFFNLSDTKDNSRVFGATFGSNPEELAHFHIWYQILESATDTIPLTVTIDYAVQFHEPKDLSAS